jgi:hypothetical protein
MTTPHRFALIAAFFLLGGFAMPASARAPDDMNARIDTLFGEHGALLANSDGVRFGNGENWLGAICTDACASSRWTISPISQAE